jgi:hypothetical protein
MTQCEEENPNPNVTVIPLSFDNGFLQVTRGAVTMLVIDLGEGAEVASADLSDGECKQLIAALSTEAVEE